MTDEALIEEALNAAAQIEPQRTHPQQILGRDHYLARLIRRLVAALKAQPMTDVPRGASRPASPL